LPFTLVRTARQTIALGSADPAGCRRRTATACGFKALLPGASSSRHPRFVRSSERSMLSWVSGPFRVFPHRPCADVSPRGSSRELSIRFATDVTSRSQSCRSAASPAPRSLHKVGTGRAQLSTTDPPGVSHLIDQPVRDSRAAPSWLMVSPRVPHGVAAARAFPLRTVQAPCRSSEGCRVGGSS
jgi:hypothetical protein